MLIQRDVELRLLVSKVPSAGLSVDIKDVNETLDIFDVSIQTKNIDKEKLVKNIT